MSTIPETISVLEEYNKWRRGDETISMPDPFEIGVAIDDAVRLLRELAAERAEVERLTKQIKDDNRSYGCELRDPNGTIWEQAAKDHARAERAEAELKASRYETVKAAQEGLRECIRAERAEAALAEAKVERETVAEASLRSLESYIDKLKQFATRAEKAEAECLEQARLLGKSGEREAELLGKLERLAKDKARLDWLAVSDVWFDFPATGAFTPETFRAAIDAGMKP
jgi:DNA repair exonuclease SbcCD ATPase subunit